MAEDFKVGDTVRLRYGGQKMTVTKGNVGVTGNLVSVYWFAGSKRQFGAFLKSALVAATGA
jgi:uncharacterized protein YodC (DUF2158 family)